MAKKKIELFIQIHNAKHFEHSLQDNLDKLICAEVYSSFAGSCTALNRLFTTIKLDWSDGKMVLLKVPADEIEALERFRGQSEPAYIFIVRHKVTKVFRGINSIKFSEVAKEQLYLFNREHEGIIFDRPMYELYEPTPDEMDWMNTRAADRNEEMTSTAARRAARQAARKRHRAELMVPHLQSLNFVLFWPHCMHAHPELYERWDINNIVMIGREEVKFTEEKAKDIMYAGDADLNEASLHKLLSGQALAICFRLLDADKHFVSLVRKILYEEIPDFDDSKSIDEQRPRMSAFDIYKSYSPTREEVWQERRQQKTKRKEEVIEQRTRRLSEMQRLARQAIEEAIETKRVEKEQRKLELLKAGNLSALDELHQESNDNEVDIEIPEELEEDVEEESSEEEDENEYFPPPGLLIPGFYAPPNDVAKVNGLAVLFPKLISDYVTPQPEFLPPHVLVMLEITKRYKAIEAIAEYKPAIIHMGVFKASTPYDSTHIAYSVKQFDTFDNDSMKSDDVKLVFMLSIKIDLPLLELMDLNPVHVSRDSSQGEEESAAMFPVNYGDEYPELEDFC